MAGYKFLNTTNAANASASAALTTTAISTTGADLIVLTISNNGAALPVVSDNQSNTWTLLTSHTIGTGNAQVTIAYVHNPTTNASHTFTIGAATNVFTSMCVLVFSGSLASPADQQNGATTSGNATTQTTGSITPSVSSTLIVACVGTSETNPFTVAPVDGSSNALPFSKAADINVNGSNHFSHCSMWAIQGAAVAESVTFSWSTAGGSNPAAMIASFKPTTSGGGGTTGYASA